MALKSQKLIDASLLVFSAIIAFFAAQLFDQLALMFNIPSLEGFPVSWGVLLGGLLGLGLFIFVRRNKKILTFLQEVVQEFTKVTWPNRRETVLSTGVVIVMIAFASILVFSFDTLWAMLTKSLLGS